MAISRPDTKHKRAILSVAAISLSLGGCDDYKSKFPSISEAASNSAREIFDYKTEISVDDFASVTTTRSSSSAEFEKKKLVIYVTATCVKKSNSTQNNSSIMELKSVFKGGDQRTDSIYAVLYNVDGSGVQRYGDITDFRYREMPVEVNLDRILSSEDKELPEHVKFRLIRGGSPAELMIADVDRLSELPKIDLKIPVRTSNVGKVVADCRTTR